jgi:N6-adenosine-specific RNA methylase IME4
MASCILYQNPDSTVILIDIPRSIEEAQGDSSPSLLSSKPIEHPFPSVEPKSEKAKKNLGEVSLEELLLQKRIQLSLDQLKSDWNGEWCLPRCVKCISDGCGNERVVTKRKASGEAERAVKPLEKRGGDDQNLEPSHKDPTFFGNSMAIPTMLCGVKASVRIPPASTALCGDIASTIDIFTSHAPKFDLIILDPPWPNRSARRKQSYGISYGNHEIRTLLLSLPLTNNLAEDALVATWVTNKPAFREMVLGEAGLFEELGVQLVEEWIWLKVTSAGEPVSKLSSMWRKPYEILLVGERGVSTDRAVQRRVLVGVPDLHSRKPNLKSMFEQVMKKEKYEALEVFARNLTAGWWGWGNEVLKFQSEEHWAEENHDTQDIP